MILLFYIDAPHIVVSAVNVVNREHRGEHGVVLVVVLVHAITADKVNIGNPITQML